MTVFSSIYKYFSFVIIKCMKSMHWNQFNMNNNRLNNKRGVVLVGIHWKM